MRKSPRKQKSKASKSSKQRVDSPQKTKASSKRKVDSPPVSKDANKKKKGSKQSSISKRNKNLETDDTRRDSEKRQMEESKVNFPICVL